MSIVRRSRLLVAAAGCAAAVGGLALAASRAIPAAPEAPTPTDLLTQPIPDTSPNAGQVRRGQYLVAVGDCMSCHTRSSGEPLAGGLGLNTPFGVIYSPNITSDRATGVGGWSADTFYRAMHEGKGAHGEQLYPAFPYPWFTHVSRADDDAILAYLKTTPAVRYTPPGNRLPFPLNIRFMVKGWNLLFFRPSAGFRADPARSAEWNRGAEIVGGLGHCSACHSPKNILGADKKGQFLRSGVLDNWTAPNLTGDPHVGLGGWSVDDITEYLKTGRNARAGAAGSMAEAVSYSTSLMTDGDRHAIAVYLKSLPPSPAADPPAPDAAAMRRGAAVYSDACASCHLAEGQGQPRYFPPLRGDTMAQQQDATGLLHLILAGGRTAPTPTRPTPLSMPSFAWKLDNQEVADVATYIRNSWGSRAAPVSAGQAGAVRRRLGLDGDVHLTVNSTDHPGWRG
ncbi:MAG: cytochrome c [Caulobacteraceae bacterium]|nr:cytochrome c [Caulobacter sp.]